MEQELSESETTDGGQPLFFIPETGGQPPPPHLPFPHQLHEQIQLLENEFEVLSQDDPMLVQKLHSVSRMTQLMATEEAQLRTAEGQVEQMRSELQKWLENARLLAGEVIKKEEKLRSGERKLSKMKRQLHRIKLQLKKVSNPGNWSEDLSDIGKPPPPRVSIAANNTAAMGSPSATVCNSINVLIVEDNEFQAYMLDEMCQKCGYSVTVANSGDQALELLSDSPEKFSLVLLDVVMPGTSGFDVLLQLRRNLKEKITVIMVSSNDKVGMVEKCILNGADSYMLKPPSIKEIKGLWQYVVRRQNQFYDRADQLSQITAQLKSVEETMQRVEAEDGGSFTRRKAAGKSGMPRIPALQSSAELTDAVAAVAEEPTQSFDVELLLTEMVVTLVKAVNDGASEDKGSIITGLKEGWQQQHRQQRQQQQQQQRLPAAGGGGESHGGACGADPVEEPVQEAHRLSGSPPGAGLDPADNVHSGEPGGAGGSGSGDGQWLCRICEELMPVGTEESHLQWCAALHKCKECSRTSRHAMEKVLVEADDHCRNMLNSLLHQAVFAYHKACVPFNHVRRIVREIMLVEEDKGSEPLQRSFLLAAVMGMVQQAKTGLGTEGMEVAANLLRSVQRTLELQIAAVQELIKAEDTMSVVPAGANLKTELQPSIKDFKVVRHLRTGGFSQVWLARKKSTGDVFAIKAMCKTEIRQRKQAHNIKQEHAILSHLDIHPLLVQCFFSFVSRKYLYFVLEFCAGGDLSTMLSTLGCLVETHAKFYAGEITLALEYLHSNGVVHHDLKPANVLLSNSGHIKLADFGLSGNTVELYGTLNYAPPEVLQSKGSSKAVDFWALGVVLFEMLTGEKPFHAERQQETVQNILNALIRWPLSPMDLSEEATHIIQRFLTVNPDERLGMAETGKVWQHAWLAGTERAQMHSMTPPFVPSLKGPDDCSYFMGTCSNLMEEPNFSSSTATGGSGKESSSSCSDWRPLSRRSTVQIDNLAHRTSALMGQALLAPSATQT